jgi:hypothetical protein
VTTYTVLYSQTEYRSTQVEADSEEEARAKVLDFDFEDSSFEFAEGMDIADVTVER